MESAAETRRLTRRLASNANAERSGETILDLAIAEHTSGLGGRFLLTLVKRNRTLALPWNRLRVGSPVVLSVPDGPSSDNLSGVVSARTHKSIQIAVSDYPDGDRFRLDLSPDEITRKRQAIALQTARDARGRMGELRSVLMGERDPRFDPEAEVEFLTELNPSQQSAVRFALSAEDVAIIHGPPGTGKTTTVIELILQAVEQEQRVLACAPSNTAVDNLLERLVAADANVVRCGHPARVMEGVRDYSLDMLVQKHENTRWVKELMRDAENLYRRASRYTRAKPAPGARQDMRREARRLKADARELEKQAVRDVLDRASVLCATTTFDRDLIGDRHFDLVVIDEACQSTEPGCWVPLLHGDRVVLAGDHCQLPPTVISADAAREGFDRSMLERLIDVYGDRLVRRLDVQYRMHEQIMQFSSERFYDGGLQADASVIGHLLSDLAGITPSEPLITKPVTFYDSASAGWDEEQEPDGESRLNQEEARLILRKAAELQAAGLPASDIAIIAPYAAQVRWLRQRCADFCEDAEKIEIGTVDGFQGREKEAVLITLVRSNSRGEIGFLADTRRMNVALTRARRKLMVVGDSATLGGNEFYAQLLEYFETIGGYHSVWEEM